MPVWPAFSETPSRAAVNGLAASSVPETAPGVCSVRVLRPSSYISACPPNPLGSPPHAARRSTTSTRAPPATRLTLRRCPSTSSTRPCRGRACERCSRAVRQRRVESARQTAWTPSEGWRRLTVPSAPTPITLDFAWPGHRLTGRAVGTTILKNGCVDRFYRVAIVGTRESCLHLSERAWCHGRSLISGGWGQIAS